MISSEKQRLDALYDQPSPLTQIAPFELRITDPPGAQRLTVNRR